MKTLGRLVVSVEPSPIMSTKPFVSGLLSKIIAALAPAFSALINFVMNEHSLIIKRIAFNYFSKINSSVKIDLRKSICKYKIKLVIAKFTLF